MCVWIYIYIFFFFRRIANDSPLKYRTDYILCPSTGDLGHRAEKKKGK